MNGRFKLIHALRFGSYDSLLVSVVRFGSLLIAFFSSMVYARVLGAEEYGKFSVAHSLIMVACTCAALGLQQVLIRDLSRNKFGVDYAVRKSLQLVSLSSFLYIVGCIAAIVILGDFQIYIFISIAFVLAYCLALIKESVLTACQKYVHALYPGLILAPVFTAIVVIFAYIGSYRVDAKFLLFVTVVSIMLGYFLNSLNIRRYVEVTTTEDNEKLGAFDIKGMIPFFMMNALYLLSTRIDLILVGYLSGAESAGSYAVALKVSDVAAFFLISANTVLAPKVSRHYSNNKLDALQADVYAESRAAVKRTLALAIVLSGFAVFFLTSFYGEEYSSAALLVPVLVASHLITTMFGPAGIVLNMTKHANISLLAIFSALVVNVVLNLTLIPMFGIYGAAFSTGFSMVFCAAIRCVAVHKALSINTLPIR